MKSRPILFSTPMVSAVLDGRKTQTRRLLKWQPPAAVNTFKRWVVWDEPQKRDSGVPLWLAVESDTGVTWEVGCPYGAIGDHLWVREAWCTSNGFDELKPSEILFHHNNPPVKYLVDGRERGNYSERTVWGRYRHARFMPRWASRLTLEITDVRVQRLQDISEEDARAEGCPWSDGVPDEHGMSTQFIVRARKEFSYLWDSIHDNGAFDLNPWVFAISFKVVTP